MQKEQNQNEIHNNTPEASREFFIRQLVTKGSFSYLPDQSDKEISFAAIEFLMSPEGRSDLEKLLKLSMNVWRAAVLKAPPQVQLLLGELVNLELTKVLDIQVNLAVAKEHGRIN